MDKRPPAGSPGLLRRLNSAAVLRAIRADGPVSRAEISRTTGLSKPTVNLAVELLLEQGYLDEGAELAAPGRPGRRPRLLRFASGIGHVLGIDIGANKVLVLAADLAGEVLAVERRKTGARRGDADSLLALVDDAVSTALDAAGIPAESLKAVGVGTPGIVDPVSGRVTLAPQLGGWEGIELAKRLEPAFSCPVLVDNEVRLSLLAERWRGAAQTVDDAFLVQIGVGIGGGVLFGGEVYRGAGGAAGEIGYLPLFDDAEPRNGLGPFEHAAGGQRVRAAGAPGGVPGTRRRGSGLRRGGGGRRDRDAGARRDPRPARARHRRGDRRPQSVDRDRRRRHLARR